MYKGNVRAIGCLFIFVVLLGSLIFANTSILNSVAFAGANKSELHKDDFMIKDFGVGNDGNPFLTVVGNPGRSTPQNENTGYAYIFETDKGTYAVTSDWMYPKWHAHEITLDENNCIGSMDMKGGAEVSNMVKVTRTNATVVDKVMTAEFSINSDDGSICPTKIFDSAPQK